MDFGPASAPVLLQQLFKTEEAKEAPEGAAEEEEEEEEGEEYAISDGLGEVAGDGESSGGESEWRYGDSEQPHPHAHSDEDHAGDKELRRDVYGTQYWKEFDPEEEEEEEEEEGGGGEEEPATFKGAT